MSRTLLSYAHGACDVPLRHETIGICLDNAATRWPDREAFVICDQQARMTFAELQRAADDLAAGLLALGLEPGDRVGIWSPNNAAWVLTQYGTAKAGLIMVNINPAYRAAELEYALNKVECRALICADRFKTTDYLGMLRALAPEIDDSVPGALQSPRLPHLSALIHIGETHQPGFLTFSQVLHRGGAAEHARLEELAATLQPDDPINIQFTSGTTGSPKAATLTHHGILNNAFFIGMMGGAEVGDRFCMPLPLYHCGGMVCGSLCGVVHGMTVVYPGEGFDPTAMLQALHDEQCTALGAVPTMFIAMLNHPEYRRFDLSSLRKGFIGGAPCPEGVMRRLIEELGMQELTIVYGMTETSPVSTQTSGTDTIAQRVRTVGRVHPHAEIKIVDPEGRTVPRGTQGEICTRGYLVMQGYWNGAAQTAEAIDAARWMHTGDLGTMDADGYIAITGRSKDMVIRGGENIYPREVEEFLYAHPAVADVQAFGVPDAFYGEELCAWIRLREGMAATEEEIKAFCRGRITHFKIPRYVRFVDSYPMTVTGKVQKYMMREMMARELETAPAVA
ncbi:MAG TPA: AMP-binding protein [Acetobacteraceae bacterium]|nr:AMP-binding protein [Acetobacteraceae bacterium]